MTIMVVLLYFGPLKLLLIHIPNIILLTIIYAAHLIVSQIGSIEVFGVENVTALLDLANDQKINVTYSVSVNPQVQVTVISNVRAQLVLQYNTLYHVTVVGSHRCSRNETVFELYFSKSIFPLSVLHVVKPQSTPSPYCEISSKIVQAIASTI